jgi:hypothetical protein
MGCLRGHTDAGLQMAAAAQAARRCGRAGRPGTTPPEGRCHHAFQRPSLLIGVSARIYYPAGPVLDLGGVWTKTLHYLEQSVAHWVMRGGAMPVMMPAVDSQSVVTRDEINLEPLRGRARRPGAAGRQRPVARKPMARRRWRPNGPATAVRDRYEMELVNAFIAAGKPVFGICRGLQLLNVMHGGTLYQDIATQRPDARQHINRAHYERNLHEVEICRHASGRALRRTAARHASTAFTTRASRTWRRSSRWRRAAPTTASSKPSGAKARTTWRPCSGTRNSTPPASQRCSTTADAADFLHAARAARD